MLALARSRRRTGASAAAPEAGALPSFLKDRQDACPTFFLPA